MSRVIVITGAGVGLGRALARRFSGDGETVVLLGRTASKVEAVAEELGAPAVAVGCDVSDPDSVRAAFAAIAEAHPHIDVLINNAAIFEPFLLVNATDDQILNTVATNLAGPMLCSRAAIPLMEQGGHIINVSSESVGYHMRHLSVYQSSKAGLERFSEALRQELDETGIDVTNVRAGAMFEEGKTWDVDMNDAMAFHQANLKAGINLAERPISQFESVTDIISAVLNLPPDVHAANINLHARKP